MKGRNRRKNGMEKRRKERNEGRRREVRGR